jgi:AmpE protein
MTFVALIIGLVLVQVWGSAERVQQDGWFHSWRGQVAAMGVLPAIKLALAVLLPVVLLEIVLDALHPVLFGLLWIAAAVVLLLYSFGRGDFNGLAERYRAQCRSGDFEGAWLTARTEPGWVSAADAPASAEEVHPVVARGFLYEGYQRWFPAIFYFMVLGPAWAVAYRLLQLCRRDLEPALIERCLFFADWIPVRLLAAAFAITGDFVGSRDELLRGLTDPTRDGGELLLEVATAAAGSGGSPGAPDGENFGETAARQHEALSGLLSRSAICWLVVIALGVVLL